MKGTTPVVPVAPPKGPAPPKGQAPCVGVVPPPGGSTLAWKEDGSAAQIIGSESKLSTDIRASASHGSNDPSKPGSRATGHRASDSAMSVQGTGSTGRLSQLPGAVSHAKIHAPRKSQIRHKITGTAWYHGRAASMIRGVVHGKVWGFIMTIILLVALFMPDLWVISGAGTNLAIDITLFTVMVVFAVELACLSAVDATYFLSFFFFMDVIGTVTMVFDITFMLGMDHSSPKIYSGDGESKNNLMLLRATRAARVGVRAGRLSRVLRFLRFLPFLKTSNEQNEKGGIAGAISGQLANLLATRVACLTILLVIVIPLFDVLTFPQSDHSLRAWAERLGRLAVDETRDAASRQVAMNEALVQMRSFFDRYSYGPYKACLGVSGGVDKSWECTTTYTGWAPAHSTPDRMASAWEVGTDDFMIAFNMHYPTRTEAVFAIFTMIFIMFIMIFSGLVLSSVVTELAVRPLERMLQTVKDIASTVFKFAADSHDEEEAEEYDIDSSSEMKLLEKVVQKLAIIADLQSGREMEATEDMQEEDIGILNMMQGKNVVEEKQKQDRRSVMPGQARRYCSKTAINYSEFGMTAEVHNSWNYNTITMSKPQKVNLAIFTISRFHEPGDGYVNSDAETATLQKFVSQVEKEYLANHFHNFAHAVDVLHTTSRLMRIIQSEHFLNELEQFAILIAACAHDLGHPGVNNGFLSEVGHELALQYNDRSPLENMHCSKLYAIVTEKEYNVFANLSRDQYKEVRKYCIDTILHTDMMGHNAMVKELQLLFQMNSEVFNLCEGGGNNIALMEVFNQGDAKALAMNNLLHSADVSNPCRTWDCCRPWAMLVLAEFFDQGDQEKMLGVPVQFLNDRDKLNRPNSQIGFLEFMIVPFFAAQIKLWPKMHDLGTNLQVNIQKWADEWVQEVAPAEEEKKKCQGRIDRVFNTLEDAKKVGMNDETKRQSM